MRNHYPAVGSIALVMLFGLVVRVDAGDLLIDDYGPSTTVITESPWGVVNQELSWSGATPVEGAAAYSEALGSLATQVDQKSQFVFDLTVSSDYGYQGWLYFFPLDGHENDAHEIALVKGTTTTVILPYSTWPDFDPSNFYGYVFLGAGTLGDGTVTIDNLQATPESSTILLYALGLVLCAIYLRFKH